MTTLTSSPTTIDTQPTYKRLTDYEPLAKICSSFIIELFGTTYSSSCGGDDVAAAAKAKDTFGRLAYFIAIAFAQSLLPEANALAALTLLQRYKLRHPDWSISSLDEAEAIFLSSYIAATKVLSDDRYRMKFWVTVGYNKFTIEELTTMEREFFEDLEWDVQIDDATLATYQLMVERKRQMWKEKRDKRRMEKGDKDKDSGEIQKSLNSTSSRTTESQSICTTGPSDSPNTTYGSSSSSRRTSESSSGPSTTSSSASSLPATPSDSHTSYPTTQSQYSSLIREGERQVKQSEQNIAALDRRIEELQEQLSCMMRESGSSPGSDSSTEKILVPRQKTRHMLKEKILHVFK